MIITGAISVTNAFAGAADIDLTGASVLWGDHKTSITRTDTTGTTDGTFLNQRGFEGIVYRVGGDPSFGSGFEVMRIDSTGTVKFGSGKTLTWENNQVGIGRTDTNGANFGPFLNMRGFDGIVYRVGGADVPGAGFEVLRIDSDGVVRMFDGKSLTWTNHQVGISRTDTTGTSGGNFLTQRGFEGFIFKTVGADEPGSGSEVVRIDITGKVGIGTTTPAEKLDVNGNIKLSGVGRTITSDGDICIGTCT